MTLATSTMTGTMTVIMVIGMVALMALAMAAIHFMRANHQLRHGASGHSQSHSVHGIFPAFNQGVTMLLRLGIPVTILGPMKLLTVRGRTTGKLRTLPVDVHAYRGRRYLIATHGEGNWVFNLRAAREGILSVGRRHEPITATELSPESGGAIIQGVLSPLLASQGIRGSMLRNNLGVSGDASLADFIHVAQSHPVFELGASAR